MADPKSLGIAEFEIIATRELRKAGLDLPRVQVRARRRLSEESRDEYALELNAVLRVGGAERRLLVECRNERAPTGAPAVRDLAARVAGGAAEGGLIFSASGYEPEAVREGRAAGIALLTVADGKAAFARSEWGMGAAAPAWIPAYMAEVVDLDAAGQPRHHLVVAERPGLILDRLTLAAGSADPPTSAS